MALGAYGIFKGLALRAYDSYVFGTNPPRDLPAQQRYGRMRRKRVQGTVRRVLAVYGRTAAADALLLSKLSTRKQTLVL